MKRLPAVLRGSVKESRYRGGNSEVDKVSGVSGSAWGRENRRQTGSY